MSDDKFLNTVNVKVSLCDVTPCSLEMTTQHFRGTRSLDHEEEVIVAVQARHTHTHTHTHTPLERSCKNILYGTVSSVP